MNKSKEKSKELVISTGAGGSRRSSSTKDLHSGERDKQFLKNIAIQGINKLLSSFRELLLQDGCLPGKQSDYHTLLRFLRVRDFDVVKAKDLYLNYLKWRDEFKVDKIVKEFKFEESREVKKSYPHGFHGVDKYGRPIYIERLGMVDLTAVLQITTIDRFLKHHVYEQEKTLHWRYPACSIAAKKHIASTTKHIRYEGCRVPLISQSLQGTSSWKFKRLTADTTLRHRLTLQRILMTMGGVQIWKKPRCLIQAVVLEEKFRKS
ncbi:Sec14p-like phosphatidylinositol transfer family protein [Actinidia rufa]|uniref:Sec14p-like phosphatidylinositol transfer family protein n=1 Tax=Actinidia rufa TaxID=165716 RepID=A0A7J0GTP6_9ERIC|nr:Sec14p-like phosphatidylinositol transfer family protein [Actinidia rufa]